MGVFQGRIVLELVGSGDMNWGGESPGHMVRWRGRWVRVACAVVEVTGDLKRSVFCT